MPSKRQKQKKYQQKRQTILKEKTANEQNIQNQCFVSQKSVRENLKAERAAKESKRSEANKKIREEFESNLKNLEKANKTHQQAGYNKKVHQFDMNKLRLKWLVFSGIPSDYLDHLD